MAQLSEIRGAGLGLKRELIPQIQAAFGEGEHKHPLIANIDFLEIAPENWIGVGGRAAKQLAWFTERFPIACHGNAGTGMPAAATRLARPCTGWRTRPRLRACPPRLTRDFSKPAAPPNR